MERKQVLMQALRAFVNQRPGLEFGNYGDVRLYRQESRQIQRDRQDALELVRAVAWRDSISIDDILSAAKSAYSGRLSITDTGKGFRIDYCAGQYFPTEYRKAVCAVMAAALWEYQRRNMPKPSGKPIVRTNDAGTFEHDNINGKTPGDWLRSSFRREFGSSIARRWFD